MYSPLQPNPFLVPSYPPSGNVIEQLAQGLQQGLQTATQTGQSVAQIGATAQTLQTQLPSLTTALAQAARGIEQTGQGIQTASTQLPQVQRTVEQSGARVSGGLNLLAVVIGGVGVAGIGVGIYALSRKRG